MRPMSLWVLSVAVGMGGASACSRGDPPAEDPPAVEPPADVTPASPERLAAAAPAAALGGPVSPAPSVDASPTPSLDAACAAGAPGRCILRDWMKTKLAPAILSADFDGLRAALDEAAHFAPAGYPDWASIARDGADAARVQDLGAVKAACRSCHAQYRDRYKRELRDRPL